ncbi:MAG: methionyl-tRNA formyltransferase [Oscillospiraceae bacterium]|nr:methionyl-tRNA formyltransferase [Oscillospiraceae bacterium]
MKILYMGTPDFAVLPLQKLMEAGHEIVGVVTREDKPKGRGMKVIMTPVKEFAITRGVPVFQPTTLKNDAISDILSELKPDIIVVVAYGKILPKYVLDFPEYGCVNLHGSLLPKYRGSAPVQHAVLNGDKLSGVTTMLMNEGLDTGDILFKAEVVIDEDDTSESLFDKLSVVGAELLVDTVKAISEGNVCPVPQNDDEATYAPPILKENAKVSWAETSEKIINLIRGSFSWPIAYTDSEIGRIKIYKAAKGTGKGDAGKVLGLTDDGLEVATADGSIVISLFQVESGKRMSPVDYFRGHPRIDGTFFD